MSINNYEFNLHTNDIMINIINIIKDDMNCLMLLFQTNKHIRDNIIKNTSYITRKEDIIKINKMNFEKIYKYIRIYSELKVNNDNNMLEYFSKIQNLIPYMVSSHIYKLNIELCVNYSSVNYWANNPPKYMDRCMIEESKMLYSIITPLKI